MLSSSGTALEPGMHPFPEAQEVFGGDTQRHARHFLPLISVDASTVDSSWEGRLHLVAPKEVCDGAVGEHCQEAHNEYCKDNVVAFKVAADGRYTFMTDFRFFVVESGPKPGSYVDQKMVNDFERYYARFTAGYDATKAFFLKTGRLNPWSDKQPERMLEWLEDGIPYTGAALQLDNGKSAKFLCRTNAYRYGSGEVEVALYFEPIERIAVIVCDFS